MEDEYRVLEEKSEHDILIHEAEMVGENNEALIGCLKQQQGQSLLELMQRVPYPHLTEYSLGVMEGMGIVAHIIFDDEFDKNDLVNENEVEK